MPVIRRGGRQISFLSGGRGAPVVLVHATGFAAASWRPIMAELVGEHRVVVPNLVGYGRTEPFDPEAFTLDDDVAVVAAVLDEIGEPVHLVGHSYGGFLALQLARQRPHDLISLAALEPVAFGVLWAANDMEGLADLDLFEAHADFWSASMGGTKEWLELFIDYWRGPGAWQNMPSSQRDAIERFGPKMFLEVSGVDRDRTAAEDWAGHGLPTLLLRGSRTTVASRRVTERLAAAFEKARHDVIAGADHFLILSHPSEVADVLRDHFRASEG